MKPINNESAGEGNKQEKLKKAKQSPRYLFIAEHRGGPLSKASHRRLMRWAIECSRRVLPLLTKPLDHRLLYALEVAVDWENGEVQTGAAMKASLGAHAAAREMSGPVEIAVARSIGQAVATAHMADHSMGAALYALKALTRAGKSVEEEREWQKKALHELPPEIVNLILDTMAVKEESFKL